MSEPTDPPSPGMPSATLASINEATWSDSHYVTGTLAQWLHVTTTGGYTWTLGASGPGAYSIAQDVDARMRAATRQTDGSFRDPSGQAWWLSPSGHYAVAVNV